MVIVNEDGEILRANSETQRLFGYAPGELVGRQVETLIPARYRGAHDAHRRGFSRAPRVRPMGAGLELRGLGKDGGEFPVEISLSPLQTPGGIVALAAIRDATERKSFEDALKRINVGLELANLSKDRFLAGMSHELRTPLTAILGFTGTLLMGLPGPLTEEQKGQLQRVHERGEHLLSLIEKLLDVTQLESENVESEIEPIDARSLLEEVASGLRPLAEEKQLGLEVALPEAEATVTSDRRSLSQILINLTGNAIKFTEQGEVRIEFDQQRENGSAVTRFNIVDTGVGIKPEDREKLFAAFEQADTSATRRHEGTGLGLYISQRLASLIGGTISCESEYGKGSSFALELRE